LTGLKSSNKEPRYELVRAASHYGHPSEEDVELSGQTLLRVQRNGLKIAKEILELEPLVGPSVKPPKVKPKVQTHSMKKEHPTLFPTQNNPSNLTAKILLMIDLFYGKKKLTASRPKFGFPFPSNPNFLQEFVAFFQKVIILNCDDLWTLTLV
jgi:hypothetical protein